MVLGPYVFTYPKKDRLVWSSNVRRFIAQLKSCLNSFGVFENNERVEIRLVEFPVK